MDDLVAMSLHTSRKGNTMAMLDLLRRPAGLTVNLHTTVWAPAVVSQPSKYVCTMLWQYARKS